MKTTVDITDELARDAKAVAAAEETTLRVLIEEGLRWVIAQRKARKPFCLRDASVSGDGLHEDMVEGRWEAIRDLAYRGRGA